MTAYSLSTVQTDPIRNFKFLVTFSSPGDPAGKLSSSSSGIFGTMGFVSVSGLSIATETIAYREGGFNTNVHQIPGQTAFTPITLTRGSMIGQSGSWDWMSRLFSVLTPTLTAGTNDVGSEFRVDLDIQVLSHPNVGASTGQSGTQAVLGGSTQHTSLRFKVYNAWITSLAYSNLDAGSNTLMVEEMTLVHEGFEVSYAPSLATTAPEITR